MVKPFRYHAVYLNGVEQLDAFAARLEALDSPPVVRHLLIAGLCVPNPNINEVVDCDWRSLELWLQARARYRDSQAKIDYTVRGILTSCAPYLYTFACHDWQVDLDKTQVEFPHLHDATLISGSPGCIIAEDTHTRFPSLRRLHLLRSLGYHYFWEELTKLAPHITHLRLSNVTTRDCITPFLRVLLDIPIGPESLHPTFPDAELVRNILSHFSALEYIGVRPQEYDSDSPGNLNAAHDSLMQALEDVASVSQREGSGRKFALLPGVYHYDPEEAHRDWLETVGGGDGQWPEGSEDVSATASVLSPKGGES